MYALCWSHLKGVMSVDGESRGFLGLFLEDPNSPFLGLDGLYMADTTSCLHPESGYRSWRVNHWCMPRTGKVLRRNSCGLQSQWFLNWCCCCCDENMLGHTQKKESQIWALVQQKFSPHTQFLLFSPLCFFHTAHQQQSFLCVCVLFEPCEPKSRYSPSSLNSSVFLSIFSEDATTTVVNKLSVSL